MRTTKLLFCIAAFVTGVAYSQTTSSTLTGVITDSSGAAVPQANVQVTNESSGVALAALTNGAGLYRIVGLIPGSYRVEVSASGFERLIRKGVAVQISETLQVDLVLKLGNIQETVTVTGATTVLSTESSGVDQLVQRQMVDGMPLPNRTSTALIALIPGADYPGRDRLHSHLQRRRRPHAQPAVHARRRQPRQHRRPGGQSDRSAAAHGRRPGIPRPREQLFSGIRSNPEWRGDRSYPLRHQYHAWQRLRIPAE